MLLQDLLPLADIEAAITAGHVKRQTHPTEPLAILNYTQTCMWDKAWSPVTRACRGLIYRTDTQEIVARPFEKFFNYGEQEAGDLDLHAPCIVTDKFDGSLGILYPLPLAGGHAIATRGSFTSEQAVKATAMWQAAPQQDVSPERTWLFEIIYPENRIVLDYGAQEMLVPLAILDIPTGRTIRGADPWPYHTLAEVLAAPPRKNAEGFVAFFPATGQRVKVKQDDYVALHRTMTNMSRARLWEHLAVHACKDYVQTEKMWAKALGLDPARAVEILAAGDNWIEKMLTGVPDEFFDWVRKEVAALESAAIILRVEINAAYIYHSTMLGRKRFAQNVAGHPHAPALFAIFDRREITTYIWRNIRPAGSKGWLNRTEDVA